MRRDEDRPAAPNYTNASIVMFGVNITWLFFVLWAVVGFIGVLLAGAVINTGITLIKQRMS